MTKRLWEKGEAVDELVHRFTVGNDPELDLQILPWDCAASAAHAQMLASVGLLSRENAARLTAALAAIRDDESFVIAPELEDCHTAIETRLVEELGDIGKRIHTGRSRNDQVVTAMRLYQRVELAKTLDLLASLVASAAKRFHEIGDVSLPGYTHMQPAMPASVGMWLHAFVEAGLELLRDGIHVRDVGNSNPLGSAAGFGTSFKLDRSMTAELLGFERVQRSPIDVQNSRGRIEKRVVRWCETVASMLEKCAWDMILYSSEEYGFFTIPTSCTTGSSIMPQKRNPDVLELVRARAGRVRGAEAELAAVVAKLPSNYHRDFQYTKEPVFRAFRDVQQSLAVMNTVLTSFDVDRAKLDESMYSELYATYHAFKLVEQGTSFRDAYRETADVVKSGTLDVAALRKMFESTRAATAESMAEAEGELAIFTNSVQSILGAEQQMLDRVFAFS